MTDIRDSLRHMLLVEQPYTLDHGRLPIVDRELSAVLRAGVPGDIVELGCYLGGTTAWMRAIVDAHGQDRTIHTYDSFEGLPDAGPHDGTHLLAGQFKVSPDAVTALHERIGLTPPVVHVGWFDDTLPTRLPETIAFCYLDGDRYDSTLTGLRHVVPRLAPGGVLLLDDYADANAPGGTAVAQPRVPGVMRACQDYFGGPPPLTVISEEFGWGMGVYRAADAAVAG
ncbi:TylF/MycF/NovP-related O-methyltransferase [Nocardia sp. BMG51109]|uniref:TylF/MycF/NovP-related O-methyltransferase n=1 Tax=Nocardia sp. BMG51109 TaxID=1056816 RepID=UPI0004AD9E25|nr:TylF/MycF/NovP-related O-methyltransferase [Nocardia sp. BMG51109]